MAAERQHMLVAMVWLAGSPLAARHVKIRRDRPAVRRVDRLDVAHVEPDASVGGPRPVDREPFGNDETPDVVVRIAAIPAQVSVTPAAVPDRQTTDEVSRLRPTRAQ